MCPADHLYFKESPSELWWSATGNVAPRDSITGTLAPKVWWPGEGLTLAAGWAQALIQPEREHCGHGHAVRPGIQAGSLPEEQMK